MNKIPQKRSGFDTRPDNVRFLVDNVAKVRFFSDSFGFPLSVTFHQNIVLIHSSIVNVIQPSQLTASSNNTIKVISKVFWSNYPHYSIYELRQIM